MTEDGGHGPGDGTVDSVTGLLASRLGAVGESAGEVMRRDVRTAAGGAESAALLVQADSAGARELSVQLPGAPGHIAGSVDIGPVPDGFAEPQGNPPDRHATGDDESEASSPTGLGQAVAAAAEPAGVADAGPESARSGSARERETGTPESGATGVPGSEGAGRTQSETGGGHPASDKVGSATTEAAPAADSAQATGRSATSDTGSPAAVPGQTPWTPDDPGRGATPGRDQAPGATPWNTGANSAPPPHMPSLPGGLPGSLTPQERPPRGNPPWGRGRGGGTAFPRARPDEHPPGRLR